MTGIDNWEYAKFVQAVGRSLRINPATDAELTAAQTFYTSVLAYRTWLTDTMYHNHPVTSYLDNENSLGRDIYVMGRNMMKIPIQDSTEKGYCDTLFTATSKRKYGDMGTLTTADVDHSSGS